MIVVHLYGQYSLRCPLALRNSSNIQLRSCFELWVMLPLDLLTLSPYQSELLNLGAFIDSLRSSVVSFNTRPFFSSVSTVPRPCSVWSFLACFFCQPCIFSTPPHAHRRTACRCSRPDHSLSFSHLACRNSPDPLVVVRRRPSLR